MCNTHAEDTLYSSYRWWSTQYKTCMCKISSHGQTDVDRFEVFCSKLRSGDFEFTTAHLRVIWQLLENLHYMLLLHSRFLINVFFEFLWTVLKNCHNLIIMEMYSIKQIDAFWVKMFTDLRLFVCVRKVRLLQLLFDRLA